LDPAVAFGHVLRVVRREAGLTQEQLSFKAEVERNFVSLIERGVNQPSVRVIFKLSAALGKKPSEMLAMVENEIASKS
jgi:transcriptional regulator with XRE-family HTH domain